MKLIRHTLPGAFLVLCCTGLPAQNWGQTKSPADLRGWASQYYAGQERVPVRRVIRAARRQNWVWSPADASLLKLQLRALSKEQGGAGRFLSYAIAAAGRDWLPSATGDAEYNDTEGFANDLGRVTTTSGLKATGSLQKGETDSFRIHVPVDGILTFSNSVNGTVPVILLANENGDEVGGMAQTTLSVASVEVPAGVYVARLHAKAGSAIYSLTASLTNKAVPTIALGKKTTVTLGNGLSAFRVVLSSDGRLVLKLSSANAADTSLVLLCADWRYIFDVDDASWSAKDAGLSALLPKGTYYVYLGSDKITKTTIEANFTSKTIPVLAASKFLDGNISGQESFELHRMVVGTGENVGVTIRANGVSKITDSYLQIYDKRMCLAAEADDENGGASSLSSMMATIPPGLYYAASTGYWSKGGYRIARTKATGSMLTAKMGLNAGAVAKSDNAQTFKLSARTPIKIEFDVREKTLKDAEVSVLDARSGLSLGFSDESFDAASCNFGRVLPAGDYYVVVKDWDGRAGSFDVRILAPLARFKNDRVFAHGHEGSSVFVLAGSKSISPTPFLSALLGGNLMVDLSTALVVPMVMPKGGVVDSGLDMRPGSGLVVQFVEFPAGGTKGSYSNLLQ